MVKQQADQVARAAVSLVDKLLPVLDALDLATDHRRGRRLGRRPSALVAVASLLHDVLAKEGLERIDPVGEAFDPNVHEAVGHVPAEEAGPDAASGDARRDGEPASRWWPR